jgi:hypothetical protein
MEYKYTDKSRDLPKYPKFLYKENTSSNPIYEFVGVYKDSDVVYDVVSAFSRRTKLIKKMLTIPEPNSKYLQPVTTSSLSTTPFTSDTTTNVTVVNASVKSVLSTMMSPPSVNVEPIKSPNLGATKIGNVNNSMTKRGMIVSENVPPLPPVKKKLKSQMNWKKTKQNDTSPANTNSSSQEEDNEVDYFQTKKGERLVKN